MKILYDVQPVAGMHEVFLNYINIFKGVLNITKDNL